MRWNGGPILLLVCFGQIATGELFKFDLSTLRQNELCMPSSSPNGRGSAKTCPLQNYVKLFYTDKAAFLARIAMIQSASANRAVALFIMGQTYASLIDASILAPVGKQIVEFIIAEISQADLTSHFPAIGLDNLLDLRFMTCPGLKIHKADFSGLKNIRAIQFREGSPAYVEKGTFTDLPTLQTLALGNDIGDWNTDRLARDRMLVYKQLKCDPKNAWLMEFLKGKPGLLKTRSIGEIFKMGDFISGYLPVSQPDVKCK